MIWLPAGGAKAPPSRRDDRPRRALHPDGGQGDLPLRDEDDGDDGARRRSARPGSSPTTSTCSSRTRPTSGSSRRSRRASTCRWTGCSSTSTGTATRRRRPCRSPWPRRSTRAGSRSATTSCIVAFGAGFTSRRGDDRVDRRPGPRDRRRRGRPARGRPRPAARSTGTRSTRSRRPSPSSCAGPGRSTSPLDDVVPGEPERAPHGGPRMIDLSGKARPRHRWLARDRPGDRAAPGHPGRRRRVQLPGQRGGGRRRPPRRSRRSAAGRSRSRAT